MLFHCKKNRNNIYKSDVKVIFKLYVYVHFRCIWILHPKEQYFYQVLSYSFDLKAPWELGYLLSKAEPGKFHGYGGQSKRICLQDRVNFLRSFLWQIVLIINIALPFCGLILVMKGVLLSLVHCYILALPDVILLIILQWSCRNHMYADDLGKLILWHN